MTVKIFVYGTLRDRDKEATHILPGFCLHRYTWFPFIKEGDGTVRGNIKRVSEAELPDLDRYEGVPSGLYKRVLVRAIALNKDKETKVWVYVPDKLLEGDPTVYPVINSGDWLKQ